MTEQDTVGANEGEMGSTQGAERRGGVVREGLSKAVRLDPGLEGQWVFARHDEGRGQVWGRGSCLPLPLFWCRGLAVLSRIQNVATPWRVSSSPTYLGRVGVASGFSQLPRKSPLQETEGPLQEDDSSLLECTVFRAGSGLVRDLPGVSLWGLRDESASPPGAPSKPSPA